MACDHAIARDRPDRSDHIGNPFEGVPGICHGHGDKGLKHEGPNFPSGNPSKNPS